MMGAMRRAGVTFEWIKDDDEGCEVKATRRDGDSYTSTFTPVDAKRASLTGQHGRYPRRMCKWRCVSDIWNTLCPDLGGGPIYTTEELHEDEPEPGDKSNEAFRAQAEANRQTEPEKSPFRMTRESAADPLAGQATSQNPPASEEKKQEAPVQAGPAPAETKAPVPETKQAAPETKPPVAETKAPVSEPSKPAARGRGAKKADAPASAAGPQLVPDQAKEQPKSGFVASNEDLPVELGGQATTPEPPSQIDRIKEIDAAIQSACGVTADSAREKVREFMIGFCHPEKLSRPPRPDYEDLIPFAAALAKHAPKKLLEQPDPLGTACRAGWEKLKRWMDKEDLHAALKALVIRAAHECFYEDGGESLIDFFEGIIEPDGRLDEGSRTAFLQIYLAMPAKDIAMKLLDKAQSQDKTLAEFLGPFDASKLSEGQVLTMIAGGSAPAEQDPLWQE